MKSGAKTAFQTGNGFAGRAFLLCQREQLVRPLRDISFVMKRLKRADEVEMCLRRDPGLAQRVPIGIVRDAQHGKFFV